MDELLDLEVLWPVQYPNIFAYDAHVTGVGVKDGMQAGHVAVMNMV